MATDTVADSEILYRHIPGGTLFQARGPRITSKNFALRPEKKETGVSVSRAGITSPAALMARVGNPAAGSRIAWATVAEVRAIGVEVVPTPIDPDDLGHAEIRSASSSLHDQSTRRRLADLFQFIDPSA